MPVPHDVEEHLSACVTGVRQGLPHDDLVTSEGGQWGGRERNVGIEAVTDPEAWVYFLDDDNHLHHAFAYEFSRAIHEHPEAEGFIFSQQWPGGGPRLAAKIPEAIGQIDTAQFVLKRRAIGSIRWPLCQCGDFHFSLAVCDANPGKIVTVPRAAAIYNAFRPER